LKLTIQCADVWANLAVQIKLHLDLENENDHRFIVGNWHEILDFWNSMADADEYENVSRECFAELQVVRKKPKTAAAQTKRRLIFRGAPPPPPPRNFAAS
jgi:hypothetical protein